jgi:hypothetical protein
MGLLYLSLSLSLSLCVSHKHTHTLICLMTAYNKGRNTKPRYSSPVVNNSTVDPRKSNTIRSNRRFDFRVKCHEPHDAVQCRAHGSTSEFLFESETKFFSNFLFEFQVVRESNRSTFEGPLYLCYSEVPIIFLSQLPPFT